jgi:hypothetical protein
MTRWAAAKSKQHPHKGEEKDLVLLDGVFFHDEYCCKQTLGRILKNSEPACNNVQKYRKGTHEGPGYGET